MLPSSRAKYGWVEVAAFLDSPGWLSQLTNVVSKYSKLNASIVMHRGIDCHYDSDQFCGMSPTETNQDFLTWIKICVVRWCLLKSW